MKYEHKNNLGILLAIGGSFGVAIGLLFFQLGSAVSFLALGVSLVAVFSGFYLMTRGFSAIDNDHPDYPRWQQLVGEESADSDQRR